MKTKRNEPPPKVEAIDLLSPFPVRFKWADVRPPQGAGSSTSYALPDGPPSP
jgi:hypothetical protein